MSPSSSLGGLAITLSFSVFNLFYGLIIALCKRVSQGGNPVIHTFS